ncbi:SAR2788 family putative toxin [Cerasibacillus sp. JNUCC 74]
MELTNGLKEELIISEDDELDIQVPNLEETLSLEIDYENEDIDALFDLEYDLEDNTFYVSSEVTEDTETTTNNFTVDVLALEGDHFEAIFTDNRTGEEYLYDSSKLEASAVPVVAYVVGGVIVRAVVKQIAKKVFKSGLKFTKTTIKRMKDPNRFVPAQILKLATKGKAYRDPRGSKGKAYYTTMYKNGKKYNLQVIYNKKTNKIYHFHYTRSAIGLLKKIKK